MVLGNVLCDLDPKVKGQIMFLLVNASLLKLLDKATSYFVYDVDGTGQHFVYNVFLANAAPKPLDVATSNFAGE